MPTHTPNEATTQPVIVRRSFLTARIANGRTKLHVTIVQKSGANDPRWVTSRTFISASSFPYHVVRRSANTK